MFGQSSPLFQYESKGLDGNVTFYFNHLSGEEQKFYRRAYLDYNSTYDLMSEVFQNQIVMYKIDPWEEYYLWPEDYPKRGEFLQILPDNTVVEVGAAILGWVKTEEEEREQFIDRIVRDLKNSIQSER